MLNFEILKFYARAVLRGHFFTVGGRMLRWLCISLMVLVFGCERAKQPETATPSEQIVGLYNSTVLRLKNFMEPDGWVVSRTERGDPEHIGDSLIATGIAMASLPCAEGTALEDAVISAIDAYGGALIRHPQRNNSASMDGAWGMYYGAAYRVKNCGTIDKWKPALKAHLDFVKNNNGKVNPGGLSIDENMAYLSDLIGYRFGISAKPSEEQRSQFESYLVAWSYGVIQAHAACFRVHLAWLALETMKLLEKEPSDTTRNAFCSVTKEADMPTVDHYCGRKSLSSFVEKFEFNRWEYRHSRCGGWETPDGKTNTSPAVDLLLALRLGYGL